ncbi:MAG: hypothetical protein NVSMB9_15660 [Isosphaeraceae bacterium]
MCNATARGRSTAIKVLLCVFALAFMTAQVRVGGADPRRSETSLKTYHRDVAPILEARCRACHRKGQVGPFPLDTYEQARKRAGDIASVVEERRMPPWKPQPRSGPPLKHDRSMPEDEIAVIVKWAAAGAPSGNSSFKLPARKESPEAPWILGKPDLVLEMGEAFEVPAGGEDLYRCFVIPTQLPGDRHVVAIEYRPGNRRVVHHMTSWVDASREGRKKDRAEPGPGYSCLSGAGVAVQGDLGGWAPGNEPACLPEGVGRPLPRAADVILQVHYHPIGKPETDRSRIGLYLAKGPIRQTLQWNGAGNFDFQLPPGASGLEVRAQWVVPVDVEALAVSPHMHRLGRDIRMAITYPNGRTLNLITIADWDVNWQNTYYFQTPIDLPKNSVVRVLAHFDNSATNPRNSNRPPKLVTWGEGSDQEMCVGYIAVVKKGQDLTRPGAVDDLFQIFVKQRNDELRKLRARQGRRLGRNTLP